MEFNKNKSYFVSTAEFKEINKNLFVAGMLSIILGMFGVHRFYLKRKLSGFIFLVISTLSLQFGKGYAATILMFISFIEGIVYIIKGIALLKTKFINNNNINKGKYIEKFENSNTGEKNKVNIKENSIDTNKKQEINDIDIIEVSDIKTSKIPNKNVTDDTLKNNWVKN